MRCKWMPKRSHHTARRDKPNSAQGAAKGVPLSVRIAARRPKSRNVRSNTEKAKFMGGLGDLDPVHEILGDITLDEDHQRAGRNENFLEDQTRRPQCGAWLGGNVRPDQPREIWAELHHYERLSSRQHARGIVDSCPFLAAPVSGRLR